MEGVVDLKVPLLVDMEMVKNWYALEDIDKN